MLFRSDILEIKALKDRISALGGDSPEQVVTTSTASVREIDKKELEKLLPSDGLLPLVLSENSAAFSFSPGEVVTIPQSAISEILMNEDRWLIHGAKYWIRKGVLSRVSVDTEIASYLLNPGSRDLDVTDV